MHVIVCLDGSEFSARVLPAVRDVIGDSEAAVEFLRVLPPEPRDRDSTSSVDDTFELIEASGVDPSRLMRLEREYDVAADERRLRLRERVRARREAEAREALQPLAASFATPPSITVLFASDVPRAIIEHARRRRPSMIAMATHSRRPLAELLAGSTAYAVLRSGVAPVLMVHPPDRG